MGVDHVVLDVSPRLISILSASVPIALLVLGPTLNYITPRSLKKLLSEPSDGTEISYDDDEAQTRNETIDREQRSSHDDSDTGLQYRRWILVGLSVIESVLWTVTSIIRAVRQESGLTWAFGVLTAFGWLLAALFPLYRPPRTAPFGLLLFYLAHFITLLLHVTHAIIHSHRRTSFLAKFGSSFVHVGLLLVLIGTCLFYRLSEPTLEERQERDKVAKSNVEEGEEEGLLVNEAPDDGIDEITLTSPELRVTLAQWLIFSWVRPLIQKGEKTKLGYRDVWKLLPNISSQGIRRGSTFLRSKRLVARIFFNNSLDLILSITLGFTSAFLSYCAPFFLRQILQSLAPAPPGDEISTKNLRTSAYVYTALAFGAQALRAEVDLQQLWHERRAILRCRSDLMGRVYEKSLKRKDTSGVVEQKAREDGKKGKAKKGEASAESSGSASTGKIVSLMSMDCTRIAYQIMQLSSIVQAPFELVVATVFLYQLLGWTCIAGLSVVAISLPMNHVLARRRIKIHRSVLASRDRRMEVLNEFFQAIRFIKYSASEDQWLARVFGARQVELAWLLKTRLNNLMLTCVWNLTPDLVMLIAFACYTKISHKELDVPTAFTSLALFALVRVPMNMLPAAVTSLLQTWVSIQRLEQFFEEEEVEDWVTTLDKDVPKSWNGDSEPVQIIEGRFRYPEKTKSPSNNKISAAAPSSSKIKTLRPSPESTTTIEVTEDVEEAAGPEEERPFELVDINLSFPVGKLSLIAGPTGSGKSSIFLALLGEMGRIEGQVRLTKGTRYSPLDPATGLYDGVAYSAQLSWLQHASIKNNILFGSPFEAQRYQDVIEACALEADLEMFPAAGDETEIGEKGISLSGGQRARVALARAIYSRAKTLLLDDPLSAVDSHTARHLFRYCLKGPLVKGRTIILVTHHISLCLPGAEYLIRMSAGRIELQGLVQDLDLTEIVTELADEFEESLTPVNEDGKIPPKIDSLQSTSTSRAVAEEAVAVLGPDAIPKPGGKLIEVEARETGRVKGAVYRLYLKAAGVETWILIVGLILLGRWIRVADRWWLKIWGESYEHHPSMLAALFLPRPSAMIQFDLGSLGNGFVSTPHTTSFLPQFPSASESVNPYLAIYGLIAMLNIVLMILGMLAGYHGSFKASRYLFVETLTRVTHAPFRYFDTTPTGRILNRFSSDFQTIDSSLTDQVRTCMMHAFSFVVNVGVIILVSPQFVPPAVLIIYVYVRLSLSYVKCSRDLRRLQSNSTSPIFSKFGETLAGIVTVRAFGSETRFLHELFASVDKTLAVDYASAMINRYLLWRFDMLGALAVAITTLLLLVGGASPGLAALAITSSQSLVQSVYWLCRYVSALEVDLNAVERVTELLNTPQEPPMVIEGKRPPAHWPSDVGGIVVEDLVMSYAPALPPVIKGVSFELRPREKVGLVGRTGSGKTTMALSLLRFNDPTSGKIIIDGIDITSIGLLDLRSRVTLIPQEAVLFSGTIRSNLDPFDEHTDQECLDALTRVRMNVVVNSSLTTSAVPSRASSPPPTTTPKTGGATTTSEAGPLARLKADEMIPSKPSSSDAASIISGGSSITRVDPNGNSSNNAHGRMNVSLSTPVAAGGNNMSAGQRQLLALARALLKRNKVIIMDEATASIDTRTDEFIQSTIKEEFEDSLVLTIAHRLATVIDLDRVLVLDQGVLKEFDSPKQLLRIEGGVFRGMCEESPDWEELKIKAGL